MRLVESETANHGSLVEDLQPHSPPVWTGTCVAVILVPSFDYSGSVRMLNLFNRQDKLLEKGIVEWIFDCCAWALQQFDGILSLNETTLVIPDNAHFPGREQSVEGMANLIFDQVKKYAGVSHWPTRLINQSEANRQVQIELSAEINGVLRGKSANMEAPRAEIVTNQLQFFYDPQ